MDWRLGPQRLWDYGLKWVCDILNRTANSSRGLDGRCPLEKITGESVDISEYLDFGFYDWIWFRENAGLGETKLGRWLGVSQRVGTLMSFWILTIGGQILSRTSVQRLTNLELELPDNQLRTAAFDLAISTRLGDNEYIMRDDEGQLNRRQWTEDAMEFDQDFEDEFKHITNNNEIKEADTDFTPEVYDDTYLRKEVALGTAGGEAELGRVVKRLRDKDGLPIGTANENPILDTRMYEVEFLDGHKISMSANLIAENLFAQIDDDGYRYSLFDEIIDHRTNGKEVKQQDAFIISHNRRSNECIL